MKSFIAIALVGCLVVASLAQEQHQRSVGAAEYLGSGAEYASLPEDESTGGRQKRQFGYGGYGGGYGRGFGGGYGGGYGGYGRGFGGGYGGYGGYGR